MSTAAITVAFVNPPKEGKKLGSIKTDAGDYYWARADMLSNFEKGKSYQLDFDAKTADDGKVWKTIKSFQHNMKANNTYRETSTTDAERMFVCKLLGDYITAGKVDLLEVSVVNATNMLRKAWRATFGAKPTTAQDMNDDQVPY